MSNPLLHYADDLGIPVVAARLEPAKPAHQPANETPRPDEAGERPQAGSGGPKVRLKRRP